MVHVREQSGGGVTVLGRQLFGVDKEPRGTSAGVSNEPDSQQMLLMYSRRTNCSRRIGTSWSHGNQATEVAWRRATCFVFYLEVDFLFWGVPFLRGKGKPGVFYTKTHQRQTDSGSGPRNSLKGSAKDKLRSANLDV